MSFEIIVRYHARAVLLSALCLIVGCESPSAEVPEATPALNETPAEVAAVKVVPSDFMKGLKPTDDLDYSLYHKFWNHNTRGNALRRLGRYDEAIVEYKAMIEIDSAHTLAYNAIEHSYSKKEAASGLTDEEKADRKKNAELIVQNVGG